MSVFKNPATLDSSRAARCATPNNPAGQGLCPPRRDVVSGKRQTQRVGQVDIRPSFEMGQMPIRRKGALEESRIRDGVGQTEIDEGRKPAEVVVEAVVPVECRVSCAQTLLAVTPLALRLSAK
jgi:hypothetical protein